VSLRQLELGAPPDLAIFGEDTSDAEQVFLAEFRSTACLRCSPLREALS
jgi:hypothetical protein